MSAADSDMLLSQYNISRCYASGLQLISRSPMLAVFSPAPRPERALQRLPEHAPRARRGHRRAPWLGHPCAPFAHPRGGHAAHRRGWRRVLILGQCARRLAGSTALVARGGAKRAVVARHAATAAFQLPGGLPGSLGLELHHAAVLFDLSLTGTFVTEPSKVRLY